MNKRKGSGEAIKNALARRSWLGRKETLARWIRAVEEEEEEGGYLDRTDERTRTDGRRLEGLRGGS